MGMDSIEKWAEKSGHLLFNSRTGRLFPMIAQPSLRTRSGAMAGSFCFFLCVFFSGFPIWLLPLLDFWSRTAHSCQFSSYFFLPWLILNLGFANTGHNHCFQSPMADFHPIPELSRQRGAAVQVLPSLTSFPDSRRKSFQSILCSQFLIVVLPLLILLLNS